VSSGLRARLPGTDLEIFPLCLGGNVLGWTADERQSFAVLDRYVELGGNLLDTADVYSAWIDGNSGGESEGIIGRWTASRRNRDRILIGTKVGQATGLANLKAATIHKAVTGSLRRLQTDYIDLLYAHQDDLDTPIEETLGAFDELVEAGTVRYIAASNYSAARLAEGLRVSRDSGFPRYAALQAHYNLLERTDYESTLEPLCRSEGLACFAYYALAKGFLTGKYRSETPHADTLRADGAHAFGDARGIAVLEALDEVAAAHDASPGAVALAWLGVQPTVAAPVASARSVEQIEELMRSATLVLSADEIGQLSEASESRAAKAAL
jgi:aryl-alcohol dehydrogenase-like predicted oxidoreductase